MTTELTRANSHRATAAWIVTGAVALVAVALVVGFGTTDLSLADAMWVFVPVLFAALGSLIISRQTDNRVGWLLLAIGVGMSLSNMSDAIFFGTDEPPATMTPLLFLALWFNNVVWAMFFFPIFMLLYVFPTGNLLSRRWAWAPRLAIAMFIFLNVAGLLSEEIGPPGQEWVMENPVGRIETDTLDIIFVPFLLGIMGLVVGGVVAMVIRYRRAPFIEKEQIKWVLFASFVFVTLYVVAFLMEPWGSDAGGVMLILGLSIIPIAITVAVLRFHLYDIDVVISKTVTYGVLAAFITGVYALVVVGIGSLAAGGEDPSLALSIAAVAIVAVAFEPVRKRVQQWANRIVYGKRATPYEVLSGATARFSGSSHPDAALAEVTQLVVDGTGASEAVVWLAVGESLHPYAATPPTAVPELDPIAIGESLHSEVPGEWSVAVRHRSEVLGALSIVKPRGEAVTSADTKVLDDVAAGAGVLLRNIGLNAELAERADQLRMSRRRLIEAHDAERHRLERDLHDGAQQQVVAVKVKLGIARTLAERENAAPVAALVASLADTTQAAVNEMRAVAHGIYPPLLESEGLEVALGASVRDLSIPVDLSASDVGRYARPIEEGVYFCVLETVTHAIAGGATRADVRLVRVDQRIQWDIQSDGNIDELVSVTDRAEAFGGQVDVTSNGRSTIVSGELGTKEAVGAIQ